MKVVALNTVANIDNAPGRIMLDICQAVISSGGSATAIYGRGKTPLHNNVKLKKAGNSTEVLCHTFLSRLTDSEGLHSKRATRKLIRYLDSERPDIIHLHNLHGHYINYPLLVKWINATKTPVVWTLHDTWAITGHCASYCDCDQWKNRCKNCQHKEYYPKSIFKNNAENNFTLKEQLFSSIENMTIVPVSNWLANEIKQSFLGKYPIVTIPNGIDTEIFSPNIAKKDKNNRFKILGVASNWNKNKGLNTFIELASKLDDDNQIILVGKNLPKMPQSIIRFDCKLAPKELAELYNIADVFINPSLTETFGMTTIEAMACGTPVIVNDKTALPEIITAQTGKAIATENINAVLDAITEIKTQRKESFTDNCINHVHNNYSLQQMTNSYLNLYDKILRQPIVI